MIRRLLFLCVLIPTPVQAGLYFSEETIQPLPARWRGFLPDHRALRALAIPTNAGIPVNTTLKEIYTDAVFRLETAAKVRTLTADEAADFGAALIRLGKVDQAVTVLRGASRLNPKHFRLAANLGTAWQLMGDWDQAEVALTTAVKLAPEANKNAEAAHLKLVQLRKREGKKPKDTWDDLFDTDYTDAKKLPTHAPATLQALAATLPADGRLLWQLGELAKAYGDVRTAANILDGCVVEFGMKSENLRERRRTYRAMADALTQNEDHTKHTGSLTFISPRVLGRTFDPTKLPAIKDKGSNTLPWPVMADTTLGKGFKPTFPQYLEKLDGKTVAINGFIAPAPGSDAGDFLLTEHPIGCWFCESPDPTGMIRVEPSDATPIDASKGSIRVVGVLKLNRTNPERMLFTIEKAKAGEAD